MSFFGLRLLGSQICYPTRASHQKMRKTQPFSGQKCGVCLKSTAMSDHFRRYIYSGGALFRTLQAFTLWFYQTWLAGKWTVKNQCFPWYKTSIHWDFPARYSSNPMEHYHVRSFSYVFLMVFIHFSRNFPIRPVWHLARRPSTAPQPPRGPGSAAVVMPSASQFSDFTGV